jgi:hypothetical protein
MATRFNNEINEYKQSIDRLKRVSEKKLESKDNALRNPMDERDEVRQALERMTIRYTKPTQAQHLRAAAKDRRSPMVRS